MKKRIFKALIIASCLLTMSSCNDFFTEDTYTVVEITPRYIRIKGNEGSHPIIYVHGKDFANSCKLGDTIRIQRYGKAN